MTHPAMARTLVSMKPLFVCGLFVATCMSIVSCVGNPLPRDVSVRDVVAFTDVTCQDFLDNTRPDAPSEVVQKARAACETVVAAEKLLPQ